MTDAQHDGLAELPEMNPGPVFRLSLEGTIELANRAARALYDVDELVGLSWLALCPRLSPDMWAEVLSGGGEVECDAELRGRTFLFRLAHQPGSPRVFVYGSDVTELKRAEAKLAEQAARLAEMAQFPEMNPGPVCRLGTDGRILLANRAARTLFGRAEIQGECWFDLCPGVDQAWLNRVLASTTALTIEVRIGDREYQFTHTHPPSGREVFVYGADVTDQKAAERAILQTEKMATLGTLAAGVAHELNNPAAAVRRAADHLGEGFVGLQRAMLLLTALQLTNAQRDVVLRLCDRARDQQNQACLLGGLDRPDREEQVERWLDEHGVPNPWDRAPQLVEFNFTVDELSEIADSFDHELLGPVLDLLVHLHSGLHLVEEVRHGASRVSEIVHALKSYSYLGQAPVLNVDVNEGLRQTLVILHSKLQDVRVVEELATDLPSIPANGSELNQVWTNLIHNAVDAVGGEGTIVLRSFRDGDMVAVVVQDNGPGIPSAIASRIFDPFFTTKPPGQGTGLGLHTCYAIITKRHGGRIDVASRPGDTSFTVRLPMVLASSGLADG